MAADKAIKQKVLQIAAALIKQGYEPQTQFRYYVETGNLVYITQYEQAREHIQEIEIQDLKQVLHELDWE